MIDPYPQQPLADPFYIDPDTGTICLRGTTEPIITNSPITPPARSPINQQIYQGWCEGYTRIQQLTLIQNGYNYWINADPHFLDPGYDEWEYHVIKNPESMYVHNPTFIQPITLAMETFDYPSPDGWRDFYPNNYEGGWPAIVMLEWPNSEFIDPPFPGELIGTMPTRVTYVFTNPHTGLPITINGSSSYFTPNSEVYSRWIYYRRGRLCQYLPRKVSSSLPIVVALGMLAMLTFGVAVPGRGCSQKTS